MNLATRPTFDDEIAFVARHIDYNHWKEMPPKEWHWQYFMPSEMACKGSGKILISPILMNLLESVREEIGLPMLINSGYRSPKHNRRVGGAPGSFHVKGMAADISTFKLNQDHLYDIVRGYDVGGIGRYDTFLHVDVGPRREWDYRT